MKRILIIATLSLVTATFLYSASGGKHPGSKWVNRTINYTHPEYGDIGKAKEALDSAFSYEENLNWPLTYVAAGSYYNELYAKNQDFPALLQSADHFIKAAELDTANQFEKRMQFQLLTIPNSLINEGAVRFEKEMYQDAAEAFKRVVLIQELSAYSGEPDTSMIFNTALAAYNAADYDLAISYFEKSAAYGYQTEQSLNNVRILHFQQGDTIKSIETLKKMNRLFPHEADYTRELIRLFIIMDKSEEALEFASLGQQQQPGNEIFYYAEGAVYYSIDKLEKAEEAFKKSVEINDRFLAGYISLAQIYIDIANQYVEKSNNPKLTDKEYKEYKNTFENNFKTAIDYLKTADKIKPNDIITLETMREIYYRLSMMDEHKDVEDRIKSIKNQQ